MNVEGSFLEGKSEEVPLAYTSEDIATAPWVDDADLVPPKVVLPADEPVNFVPWNPDGSQGRLPDGYELQLPGTYIDKGPVVVEQLGPGGDVIDTKTVPVNKRAGGGWGDPSSMPYAETKLPAGVYQIHLEGDDAKYPIVVGSPSEIASAWESDLRNEANQLTDRANRIRDLLAQDHVVRSTVRTNETGHFSVNVPSNAVTTDLKAMKADGQLLKDIQSPSLENLREFQSKDYNGTFYLPSSRPKTVEAPAEGVTVTVYRSPEVPLGDMSSFADLMAFLENQRLNETISELENEYTQRLEEMENETLRRVYTDHSTLVQAVPGAKERYLERSEFSEIQAAEDLSSDELTRETRHMQVALAGIGEIEPPDLGENPINIDDGGLNLEYPLPNSVDPDTVAPEIHWSDGTVEPIPEEYYSVESTGIFGGGGQQLVISDLPIGETDPAAFDIRVQAASSGDGGLIGGGSDEGVLDDRISATNPAFGGSIPTVNAVDFSTLAPGPSENVYVGVEAKPDTGYGQLVSAEAWNDDGESINATVDTERDRASFKTDGQGVHSVRLTFENDQGDRFVVSERVRAHEQSRSDPATVRASESTLGTYAVTGEELASARIDSSNGRLKIDVIADDSDGPGSLVLKPANAMSGDEHSFEVNVLHGNSEERVNAHVPIELHLEGMSDSALYWRSAAGLGGDPVTHDGSTRFGEVQTAADGEKQILYTYTREDGSLEMEVISSPGWTARITHRIARTIGGIEIPSPLSIAGSGTALLLLGVGILKRRDSQYMRMIWRFWG
ncbi:hypothetical protein [Natrinema sp. DC36]|uniref:hypothetical protein n=1 Tax=Natrinema sp. DC36 TaxID=2878680 RepID=UPI001CEFE162|nr:hypothetical protein [Natrinema sp. DC36]